MNHIFFFSVPNKLISPLIEYFSCVDTNLSLSGLLSVSRENVNDNYENLDILYLHDVYTCQYKHLHSSSPPSGFWDFIAARELTLCRTLARFIEAPYYLDQQFLLNLYASFWFSYFQDNHFDIYIFPSTPHRGVDNVAFEVLLYLQKRVVLITEFHRDGYLLLSSASIGQPIIDSKHNDENRTFLSDSYRRLAADSQHQDSSARYTPRYRGLIQTRFMIIIQLLIPLVKHILLFLILTIKSLFGFLTVSKPVFVGRYRLSNAHDIIPLSYLANIKCLIFSRFKHIFAAVNVLYFSSFVKPSFGDIVLCLSAAPEASIYPQQSLLGYPSAQCFFLRLLFPKSRILVKYHPRLFNPHVTEFSWDGYSFARSFQYIPKTYLLDPCIPIESLPDGCHVVSGVGSSSALMAARGFSAYHLIYSHFSYILPEINILPIEKSNYSPFPLLSTSPTILSGCTLYSILRIRSSSVNLSSHLYDQHQLLGDPEIVRKLFADLLLIN